jgi:hypothetical protein
MTESSRQVGFCPVCGAALRTESGFVQEFWYDEDTIYFVRCGQCRWVGEVKEVGRVVGIEPFEDH